MFSTCFYTSFLSRDFLSFCTDSLYTFSCSHLSLHTRHLFVEIAYQITQVPWEFDTRFLPFYTTCTIRCTCRSRTSAMCHIYRSNLLRWSKVDSRGGGGARAAFYWSSSGCYGASPCASLGMQYFSMKALVACGQMNLLGATGTP